jgi:hypothetical protein
VRGVTPREFLEAVVRPNVTDFRSHFADLRHAHNAISAVDALAAHLYVWAKVNAARDQNFALLRDIAKAQKHVHLTRHNPQVTRSDQITTRPIGYGEGVYGMVRYGDVGQVVVDIAPGDFSYVENVVDESLAFLETEMTAIGA